MVSKTKHNTEEIHETEQASTAVVKDHAAEPAFTMLDGIPLVSRRAVSRTEKFPISEMEIGKTMFVANSDSVKDAGRALATLVTYVTTKTANKVAGETVTTKSGKVKPKLVPTRKYEIRRVKAGVAYGPFTAPADGALVYRTK